MVTSESLAGPVVSMTSESLRLQTMPASQFDSRVIRVAITTFSAYSISIRVFSGYRALPTIEEFCNRLSPRIAVSVTGSHDLGTGVTY